MPKRGHQYGESTKTSCPICGLLFQKSGVFGHLKYKHNLTDDEARQAIAGELPIVSSDGVTNETVKIPTNAPSDLKSLGEDVARLRLLKQRRDLTGLGESVPPTKSATVKSLEDELEIIELEGRIRQAQSRFSNPAQPQQKGWTDILNSPNLPLILTAVKGALGINQAGGDTTAVLLKDMGYSLKDLITNAMAPKSDGSLKIAGLDLGGVSLTPELLMGILQFKGLEAKAEMEQKTRDRFANQVEGIWGQLSPMIAQKLGQGGAGAAGGVSSKPAEPEKQIVYCPECGQSYSVTPDSIGQSIECQKCGAEIEITQEEKPAPKKRVRQQKPPKQPKKDTVQCSCGQEVDVTGLPLLSKFVCPVCGEEGVLTDTSTPLPAMEPKKREPESLAERNRRY